MEKIYVKEILEAVGGQLLGNIDPDKTFVVNVQTDSREAAAGDLFVAIIGERLDAHRFVPGAMAAGAEGCLVSAAPESIPEKVRTDAFESWIDQCGIPQVRDKIRRLRFSSEDLPKDRDRYAEQLVWTGLGRIAAGIADEV